MHNLSKCHAGYDINLDRGKWQLFFPTENYGSRELAKASRDGRSSTQRSKGTQANDGRQEDIQGSGAKVIVELGPTSTSTGKVLWLVGIEVLVHGFTH
jgi:hypothetical protein